jgi:hypothetical protein
MATMIRTTFVCDECGQETNLPSEIVHYTINVNQGSYSTVKEMDLCTGGEGSCSQWLEAQYAQIWRNPPKRPKAPKSVEHAMDALNSAENKYVCTCGFETKSAQGFSTHVTRSTK